MSRLFIRIWLANWLVFVVVVFGSVFVFDQIRENERKRHFENLSSPPRELRKNLIDAVAAGESPAAWAKRVSKKKRKVFLLLPDGKDINGRKLPRTLKRYMSQAERGGHEGRARRTIQLEGYPPLSLIHFHHPRRGPLGMLSPVFLVCLGFLASGLAAVALARFITRPIKQLHLATDRLASGDFRSDLAATVGGRKDEIADLARRFDSMVNALEAGNKNQQDLLRDVSHELRSPLTRLTLIADLLDKSDGEERSGLQERLKREIAEMDVLVDEVMVLARFEFEAAELVLSRCDLVQAIEPILDSARFEANALNKDVMFKHETPKTYIHADLEHLQRAIENIVRNAIRHTADNTEVLIELIERESEVELSISDKGEGVPETELGKIFSPFYRSKSARANFKGAGIGLALAERITKLHKGTISASNITGGGLQVKIQLPFTLEFQQPIGL